MKDKYRHIMDHLSLLLEYTRQISKCEDDPAVDVTSLTDACRDTLAELQRIMPEKIMPGDVVDSKDGGGGMEDGADGLWHIEEMLKTLEIETRHCMGVLMRFRDRTENELSSLRQTRKAVRAYESL